MATHMLPPEWRAARRILVVRLDNLGDVMVTTPAFYAIKWSIPEARLTLLASPVGAQAGYLNPDLADVLVYQAPWMDPWRQLSRDPQRELHQIERLREHAFDAAIIFTSFRQSPLPAAYMCYLADIPLRLAASIDGPGSLLTTRHHHPDRMMHEVERGLDLVGAIGCYSEDPHLVLKIPESARQEIAQRLAGQVSASGPLILVHPGCSMPARTYPWEQFAAVADLLIEHLGATIVLTGSADERPLVEQIRRQMRHTALTFAGDLEFPAFCALIEAADLVVTNNTGPMHLAAALQTPVVALFALTNPPEQWGPWRVAHQLLFQDVPCRICYSRVCPYGHECLVLVTPAMVAQAAEELLTGSSAGLPNFIPLQRGGNNLTEEARRS